MSGPIDLPRLKAALSKGGGGVPEQPRRAAVALVIRQPLSQPHAEPHILLVRRSERAGDPWSGHMALPGGHQQPSDRDLLHTARRETQEEVGLDLTFAELLGSLDDVVPMRAAGIAVRPFVFWLEEPGELSLSDEVAEVIWVPVASLSSGELRSRREVEVRGNRLRVPAFVVGERVVWGMTFRLLEDFLARLQAG